MSEEPVVGELGAGLPAVLLRALTGLAVLALAGVLALDGAALPGLVALGVLGLVAACLPASPAPAVVIVLVAGLLVADGDDPLRPAVLAVIPLVHLLHVSCAIAGLLPLRARVHAAALKRPAVRYLMVQTGVFLLAGAAALLPHGATPVVLEVLALLSVAALTLVIARLAHRPQ